MRDYPLKLPGPDSEMRVIEVQKRTESRIGGTMQKPTGPVVLHGVVLEDGTLEELEEDTQDGTGVRRVVLEGWTWGWA